MLNLMGEYVDMVSYNVANTVCLKFSTEKKRWAKAGR